MKEFDDRRHPYMETGRGDPPAQQYGNSKQVRQAARDRRESRGAGGDNERGLDYAPKGFSRRVPKPSKQQFKQWALEEPDLLRRLHGGDYGAAGILVERYRWWLGVHVANAVRRVSGGLRFDDVFDCALIQFLESLKEFKPGSNNGLMAYLIKAVDGAISDAQQKWQGHGFTELDTRLRRFLRNEENRKLSPEDIQKRFPKYTLEQIAIAKHPLIMQPYTEGAVDDWNGYQDADDHTAPSGYAKAQASSNPRNVLRSKASQWSKRATLGFRWKARASGTVMSAT